MMTFFAQDFRAAAPARWLMPAGQRRIGWRRATITLTLAASILSRRVTGRAALAPLLLLAAAILVGPAILRVQPNAVPPTAAPAKPDAHAPLEPGAPKVEPLVFADVDPQTARDLNAAIPYAPLGADSPAPFRAAPGSEDFARALDCLASAILYEAGDDPLGQAAVAQVVLNRVRHPAFPSSVCAVVYQGSERTTGCQFTFTCDGALRRVPAPAAWDRARVMATAFLNGRTDPRVGMATHYHTDWVHPYWSTALDKIARVDTHLFFRWRGAWGRRSAFSSAYSGAEPREAELAWLSAAHQAPDAMKRATEADLTNVGNDVGPQSAAGMLRSRPGDHLILVDGGGDGTELALQGLSQCAGESYCKVIGWDRRSQDYGSPHNPVIRTVAFLYVSDKRTGVEMVLWDCARFNRPSDSQCLSDRNRRWISFQGDLSRAS
jgi:spore germination cell wall hydrolase CwlJ-like protein